MRRSPLARRSPPRATKRSVNEALLASPCVAYYTSSIRDSPRFFLFCSSSRCVNSLLLRSFSFLHTASPSATPPRFVTNDRRRPTTIARVPSRRAATLSWRRHAATLSPILTAVLTPVGRFPLGRGGTIRYGYSHFLVSVNSVSCLRPDASNTTPPPSPLRLQCWIFIGPTHNAASLSNVSSVDYINEAGSVASEEFSPELIQTESDVAIA